MILYVHFHLVSLSNLNCVIICVCLWYWLLFILYYPMHRPHTLTIELQSHTDVRCTCAGAEDDCWHLGHVHTARHTCYRLWSWHQWWQADIPIISSWTSLLILLSPVFAFDPDPSYIATTCSYDQQPVDVDDKESGRIYSLTPMSLSQWCSYLLGASSYPSSYPGLSLHRLIQPIYHRVIAKEMGSISANLKLDLICDSGVVYLLTLF